MINYVAVGAGTVLNMVIGMAWYSPALFGTIWAKGIKFKGEPKMTSFDLLQALAVGLLITLGLAHILHHMALMTMQQAIHGSTMLWLCFVVPTHYNGVIWAQKPLTVYLVDMGYYLVSFGAIASLLAWWK